MKGKNYLDTTFDKNLTQEIIKVVVLGLIIGLFINF
jgi:hypothetical protein